MTNIVFKEDDFPGYQGVAYPGSPTNRGKSNRTPTYNLNPNQLTPLQHYAFPPASGLSFNAFVNQLQRSIGDYYGQVIPTSQNIRNRGLRDLFESVNKPMQGIYEGQNRKGVGENRVQQQEQIYNTAASRGLGSSGALDRMLRTNNLDYLSNTNKAQIAAYGQDTRRQAGLADQIQNTVNSDIDFYRNINAGRDVAWGTAAPVNIAALQGLGKSASGAIAALFPNSPKEDVIPFPTNPTNYVPPSGEGSGGYSPGGDYPSSGDANASWFS